MFNFIYHETRTSNGPLLPNALTLDSPTVLNLFRLQIQQVLSLISTCIATSIKLYLGKEKWRVTKTEKALEKSSKFKLCSLAWLFSGSSENEKLKRGKGTDSERKFSHFSKNRRSLHLLATDLTGIPNFSWKKQKTEHKTLNYGNYVFVLMLFSWLFDDWKTRMQWKVKFWWWSRVLFMSVRKQVRNDKVDFCYFQHFRHLWKKFYLV